MGACHGRMLVAPVVIALQQSQNNHQCRKLPGCWWAAEDRPTKVGQWGIWDGLVECQCEQEGGEQNGAMTGVERWADQPEEGERFSNYYKAGTSLN